MGRNRPVASVKDIERGRQLNERMESTSTELVVKNTDRRELSRLETVFVRNV